MAIASVVTQRSHTIVRTAQFLSGASVLTRCQNHAVLSRIEPLVPKILRCFETYNQATHRDFLHVCNRGHNASGKGVHFILALSCVKGLVHLACHQEELNSALRRQDQLEAGRVCDVKAYPQK